MSSFKPSFSPTITAEPVFDGSRSSTPVNSHVRKSRWVESGRLGLTVLTLILGLVIVGTTADVLRVYNKTSAMPHYLLPIWPVNFDAGPSVAILAGGCVVVFMNLLSVFGSKVAAIRTAPLKHSAVSLLAPTSSLIASIIAISFYYAINTSTTNDSIQSWSCRWTAISMTSEPHFRTICHESMTGLYLSIVLIPLQLVVVALATLTVVQDKKAAREVNTEDFSDRKGSPSMS